MAKDRLFSGTTGELFISPHFGLQSLPESALPDIHDFFRNTYHHLLAFLCQATLVPPDMEYLTF